MARTQEEYRQILEQRLHEMAMTIGRLDQHERKRKFTGDRGAKAYGHMSDEMESNKVHGLGGKVVGTLSPKGRVAHDLEGKKMGRVNVMGIVIPPPYKAKKKKTVKWMGQRPSKDDKPGTIKRVARITKFLEKHPDPSKMKAHHLNHFFNHPDYFGETDAASAAAMTELPVNHRKTIRAMHKDYYDLEW